MMDGSKKMMSGDHDARGRRLEMHQSSATSGSLSAKHGSSSHHHHHHHRHHHHGQSNYHHHSTTGSSISSSSSSHHHHHHHSSSHKHSCKESCHHSSRGGGDYVQKSSSSSSKHHHYVNAIPNLGHHSSSSRSNRYINQSDLCTQIISGNLNNKVATNELISSSKNNDGRLSFSTSVSSASSASSSSSCSSSSSRSSPGSARANKTSSANNATVAGGMSHMNTTAGGINLAERSTLMSADSSMRCTLRRGRPNTPKTGLSQDYRARKSSVPNTPEGLGIKSSLMHMRANNTISNDDMIHHHHHHTYKETTTITSMMANASNNKAVLDARSKTKATSAAIPNSVSSCSLNTAIICDQDDNADKISIMTTGSTVNIFFEYNITNLERL
jgi:hypothetical protein